MNLIKSILPISLVVLCSCSSENISTGINEPEDPDPIPQGIWENIPGGLNGGLASTDYTFRKSQPPGGNVSASMDLNAWRGEKINCQLLLWSKEEMGQIEIRTSDLVNQYNDTISSANIRINFLRYVITDEFLDGCGYRNKDTIPFHISPDIIDNTDSIYLHNEELRPAWLTFSIPDVCSTGIYNCEIEAITNTDSLRFNIEIEVLNRILPDPSEWSFHLDLWQNPYAVARYNNVRPWSQEHWELLRPLYTMLADAGQKCITTTLNDMPWGGQTYDPFGTMIEWLKNSNGSWDYDYSIFDQLVLFAMDCGITEQINCYSMVPWNNRFKYYDEDSSKFVTVHALPGTVEYENLWTPFLFDFREHLREMGWLGKTTIAMDERKQEDMLKIISLIKNNVPEFLITLAGNKLQDEIDNELYDLSISISLQPEKGKVKSRVKSGKPTTFYTSCAPPEHPNNFTFSPPANSTFLGWYAAAYGYSGFLRWAYNSWVEDPLFDSRFRTWSSGDTFLVYPGARSSVRFEKLIEGIQDYEKIRILKEDLAGDASIKAAENEKMLNEFLDSISLDNMNENSTREIVNKGKDLIYLISK